MSEKEFFGELTSEEFNVGDIVEWRKWNSDENEWESHYGVILELNNEIRSNRLVSISKVVPLNKPNVELDFFTLSLRPITNPKKIDT